MELKMKFLVLNGPNINMLGIREPDIYGKQNYEYLVEKVKSHCAGLGVDTEFIQSNHEGDLVDAIQKAYFEKIDGIIFNPAAYTHTSVAIADAVKGVGIPTVEVHISRVDEREDFRQISFVRAAAIETISGLGLDGYCRAADRLMEYIGNKNES